MGIRREQALDCFRSDDLIGLGMEADAVRGRLHPEGVVSYALARQVDCTSILADSTHDSQHAVISSLENFTGCSGFRLIPGKHWGADVVDRLERIVRELKTCYPAVAVEGPSALTLRVMAVAAGVSFREAISRLCGAGLDALAPDESRVDDVEEWMETHRQAHAAGIMTTAALVFGVEETFDDRLRLLETIAQLQDETGGFAAFAPIAARAADGRELDGVTAVERLKMLAIGRIFLDQIEHVHTSADGENLKVLQMGLRFGANDLGSICSDAPAGASDEDLRRVIRDSGFLPVQRDATFRTMFLN